MINGSLLKNLVRLHKTLEITTSFRFDWKHRGFKLFYNIASKFVKSNSIAWACFIFLLCTLMTSANKSLKKKKFSIGVENVIKTIGSYVSMLHISMNARWRMNQLLINGIEIEFLTASKAQVPLYTNALNHSMTNQMFCWIVSHAMCSLKF